MHQEVKRKWSSTGKLIKFTGAGTQILSMARFGYLKWIYIRLSQAICGVVILPCE
jgi:CTP-dependent riboflavin kinase